MKESLLDLITGVVNLLTAVVTLAFVIKSTKNEKNSSGRKNSKKKK